MLRMENPKTSQETPRQETAITMTAKDHRRDPAASIPGPMVAGIARRIAARPSAVTAAILAAGALALVVASASIARSETVTRSYTTYLGGDGIDQVDEVFDGGDGFLYLVGGTRSSSFLGQTNSASPDPVPFVARIDASTHALDWVVVHPHFGIVHAGALGQDRVYVAGWTNDPGFIPAGTPGWDTTDDESSRDSFILAFDRTTGALLAGTQIEASDKDWVDSLAIGPGGRVYAVGATQAAAKHERPFPTTPGAFQEELNCPQNGRWCNMDMYLVVFSFDLTALEYSTLLGGGGIDNHGEGANVVAVDSLGRAHITGRTDSTDFPVTDGSSLHGSEDAVLAVIDPQGNGAADLVRSAYVGGSSGDNGWSVELDESGTIWLSGSTASSDFPGITAAHEGQNDAFVARITESGSGFSFDGTTLLGGGGDDVPRDLAFDAAGDLVLVGYSSSAGFPVTADADDTSHNGQLDVFIAKLDVSGNILYSTFLGGSHDDQGLGLSLSPQVGGSVAAHLCGATSSADFPVTAGALQPTKGEGSTGSTDGFLAAYSFAPDGVCGDGACDAGESPCSCPEDCGAPPATESDCANGIDDDCDGLADCDDADCSADAACIDPCGDGICDTAAGEDPCSCPEDCGTPPASEIDCANGIDDDCDGLADCDDADCEGSAACPSCAPKNAPCTSNSDCCSGDCNTRNGKCREGAGGGAGLIDQPFIRGDCDGDGRGATITDAVALLDLSFARGPAPACRAACDVNGDGEVGNSAADAVYLLSYAFLGGTSIPAPFPDCGAARFASDRALGCATAASRCP